MAGVIHDITSHREAQARAQKLDSFYRALWRTHQAIVGLSDPQALFREICTICVDHAHASAALIEVAIAGRLQPAAWSGPVEFGLRAPRDRAKSPDDSTIRVHADGRRASFPFCRGGKAAGVLNLYADGAGFFEPALVELLGEVASAISFGLDNLDREAGRRLAVQQAQAELDPFRKMFHLSPIATSISRIDDGRLLDVNDAYCALFGFSRDELLGSSMRELRLLERHDAGPAASRAPDETRLRSHEMVVRSRSGEARDVLVSAEAMDPGGEPRGLVTLNDITERKRNEARIEFLANHDDLTALPNRALMREKIAQALAQARRSNGQLAVMFLDLDRFKVINDVYGHHSGDGLLRNFARRLASLVRPGDTVGRLGGDEFLILLPDLPHSAEAYVVAQKILDSFDSPIALGGHEALINTSIGVAVFPQDGRDVDTLVRHADVAMYRAKEHGGAMYQFFNTEINRETVQRAQLETHLRSALARTELELVYQPKVHVDGLRITGCEALLRWNQHEMGKVRPGRFIPIAEESGLIVPIGDWALKAACAQAAAWRQAGIAPTPVAVNVSARQFLRTDVVRWVLNALRDSGISPDMLELELTESLIAKDPDSVAAAIKRLKDEGVRFSIDDFGTGYSSLGYLKRFAVDALKIDRSFVKNVGCDPHDEAICLAVISLARSLRLQVVAEGVETMAQYRFLESRGCDQLQGYLFGRPMRPAGLVGTLKSGHVGLPPSSPLGSWPRHDPPG